MPRNAAGSLGSGNDCRGWNEPRGFAASASSASSPSAPLRCTTASRAGGSRLAILSTISGTAPSGTARKSTPDAGILKPFRAGTSRAGSARARLRPRFPRPATVRVVTKLGGRGAGRGRGVRLFRGDDLVELLAVDRLHYLQPLHDGVHLPALPGEDRLRGLVAVVDDAANLLVDEGGHLFRIVALLAEVAAEEYELLLVAHRHGAELLRHAPLRDHAAGHLRRALDVVLGSGRDVVEDDLLRHPAAHDAGDLVHELVARDEVLVLLGKAQGPAESHAAGDDRDLVHRVGVRQRLHHQRVTRLVVGDDLLLLLGDAAALALGARDDTRDRLLQLVHADHLLVGAGGKDRGLVDQVRQVRATEARRLAGQHVQVDRRVQRLVARVHVEDRPPALDVGPVEGDVAVEATRAKQRGVEHVGPVRGRDDDDVRVGVEAVHLHEQLVEGLLALIVSAAQAGAALSAHGVDLVHEDDAGRVLLGLVEQVADAAGADADEHLDELRARDREEGDPGLAGHGLAEQRLARAWRADEQHALGDARAEGHELLGVLEELDDLRQLLLGLVDAGDIGERDRRLVARDHPRARASKGDGLVVAALRLAQDPPHEGRDQDDEDDVRQQDADQVAARLALLELDGHRAAALHAVGAQVVLVLALARAVGQDDVVLVAVDVGDDAVSTSDVDHLDLSLRGLGHHRREVPVGLALAALDRAPREPEDEAENDDQGEIEQAGAGESTQLRFSNSCALRAPGAGGVSSLTTFRAGRAGIGASATCRPGLSSGPARSASTAMPGTHARRSPANTSGHASRSSRGTRASTKTSWSLRVPRPPSGRRRRPGRR